LRSKNGHDQDFLARADDISQAGYDIILDLHGSFSAEHRSGQLKREMVATWRGGADLETMRRIKTALDPHALLNPPYSCLPNIIESTDRD
jgi:FAD/FMN-containing dehydrogenase